MRVFRPRSILQVTVVGFMAVVVPLLAALALTLWQLDAFGIHGRRAVYEAAHAMRAARSVVEQALAMERNARQYAVLRDGKLLAIYRDRRQGLHEALDGLRMLRVGASTRALAARIVETEQRAFATLQDTPVETGRNSRAVSGYAAVLDAANALALVINDWIDREPQSLREQLHGTQRMILVEAVVLVVLAVGMAGLFTAFIARPLREIDTAIHRLGDGGLATPVAVHGPLDVQELGQRLEWLRQHLAELEQQRVAFLRQVSHELKTPLTSIQEGIALLDERVVGQLTPGQADITRILGKQCRRLHALIEELLRFDIDHPHGTAVAPRMLRLNAVIERVLSDHALAMQAARVGSVVRAEQLAVWADAEHVRVILDNLVSNAVKYSPADGTIRIELVRDGGWAGLAVRDEGPGIPPPECALVFRAFYRGHPPDTPHDHGTGLGLAIARDLARLNGGELALRESGAGACFYLRLPLQPGTPSCA